MDFFQFQGMEFLNPKIFSNSSIQSIHLITLTLCSFLAVLQLAASIFSVRVSGDQSFMRGYEYRRHALFFLSQTITICLASTLVLEATGVFSFPQLSFFCFVLLICYFGVSSLALQYKMNPKVIFYSTSFALLVFTYAVLKPEQTTIVYSLGCLLSALVHCVVSVYLSVDLQKNIRFFYRLFAVLIVGSLCVQQVYPSVYGPEVFLLLLFGISVCQWLLTLSSLWSNYSKSVSERDQAQQDSTARDKKKLESIFLNLHDDITGCPNDGYLVNILNDKIAKAEGKPFAIFCIRVRGLRAVQNALGIETANGLLKACAERLAIIGHATPDVLLISAHNNKLGWVVRSEGREFFMVLGNIAQDNITLACDRINDTFNVPFEFNGLCLDLQANIGVALYPQHGTRPQQVMQYANVAVDIAKRGSYGSIVFDPLLDPSVQRRLILLGDLRGAMSRGDIFITYQPQVCTTTNQVVGVEALLRWDHPFLGKVPPDEFVTLSEQTGMIKHLSRWVCDHAAMDFVRLNLEGVSLKMSINISPNNLLEDNFAGSMLSILEQYQIPAGQFCVEITETAVMLDPDRVIASIDFLTQRGVIFSIDDFGTGFSSLANLKRLHVKQIKIDKDFIINIENNLEDEAIVKATIEMANCLNVQTVGEGVENYAIVEKLRGLGCHVMQGYFIAKPLPIDELIDWLASRPHQTKLIQHFY